MVPVGAGDSLLPIRRRYNGRTVLYLERDVPIDREVVKVAGRAQVNRCLVVRYNITCHRLAGVLIARVRDGQCSNQVVAANIVRSIQ